MHSTTEGDRVVGRSDHDCPYQGREISLLQRKDGSCHHLIGGSHRRRGYVTIVIRGEPIIHSDAIVLTIASTMFRGEPIIHSDTPLKCGVSYVSLVYFILMLTM